MSAEKLEPGWYWVKRTRGTNWIVMELSLGRLLWGFSKPSAPNGPKGSQRPETQARSGFAGHRRARNRRCRGQNAGHSRGHSPHKQQKARQP